jgi:UDP-glucose 4-epimerase
MTVYARQKMMVKDAVSDCRHAFGLKSIALRYFNSARAELVTLLSH